MFPVSKLKTNFNPVAVKTCPGTNILGATFPPRAERCLDRFSIIRHQSFLLSFSQLTTLSIIRVNSRSFVAKTFLSSAFFNLSLSILYSSLPLFSFVYSFCLFFNLCNLRNLWLNILCIFLFFVSFVYFVVHSSHLSHFSNLSHLQFIRVNSRSFVAKILLLSFSQLFQLSVCSLSCLNIAFPSSALYQISARPYQRFPPTFSEFATSESAYGAILCGCFFRLFPSLFHCLFYILYFLRLPYLNI